MTFPSIDWPAVGAMVTAIATLFLVIATYRLFQVTRELAQVSRGLNQAQAMTQIVAAVNFSNQLVLADDRNLRAAEELLVHENLDHSDEAARKRWIAFVMLNKWQLLYFFHKRSDLGEFSHDYWNSTADQVLDRLLSHEWVLELIETRGYHPEFADYCHRRVSAMKINRSKWHNSSRDKGPGASSLPGK